VSFMADDLTTLLQTCGIGTDDHYRYGYYCSFFFLYQFQLFFCFTILLQETRGTYEWDAINKKCLADPNCSFVLAEFYGEVEVARLCGKGFGVVASQRLPPGALLHVARPIAVADGDGVQGPTRPVQHGISKGVQDVRPFWGWPAPRA
jgi:hypothetical protein